MTSQTLSNSPRRPRKSRRRAGLVLAGVLALAIGAIGPARAQDADQLVAKVDGVEIHQSDVALAEEDVGSSLPQGVTGDAKREYLVTYLADMILIARDAEGRGLSGTDDFKRRFALMRSKVLMGLLLHEVERTAVTDEAMHKVYDEAVKHMGEDEEVRARHILVETEDDAKAILGELKKGADFAELAKQKSKDPGAAEGGDLGYFTKDQMVPEFAQVAFKLDKGGISDPVKTQFGWHIIKVEDKRKKAIPSFDQVKDQLVSFVLRQAQTDLVTKLRAKAKIERFDSPAAAASPAPPTAPTKK